MWLLKTIIALYAIAFAIAAFGMNAAFADYPITTHAGITAFIFILAFFACSLTLTSLKMQHKLDEIEKKLEGDSK